jgi:hypothetical protein
MRNPPSKCGLRSKHTQQLQWDSAPWALTKAANQTNRLSTPRATAIPSSYINVGQSLDWKSHQSLKLYHLSSDPQSQTRQHNSGLAHWLTSTLPLQLHLLSKYRWNHLETQPHTLLYLSMDLGVNNQ